MRQARRYPTKGAEFLPGFFPPPSGTQTPTAPATASTSAAKPILAAAPIMAATEPEPPADLAAGDPSATNSPPPCWYCGSTAFRDVSIHRGLSIRRDCRVCHRFLDFPIWYCRPTAPESAWSGDGGGSKKSERDACILHN